MITLSQAEVIWLLNSYCQTKCDYCRVEYKNGDLDKTIQQYLDVVEKLQNTRYQHHSKVHWKIGGGEPLHFPQLGTLLKKIKERPSSITLETSGDDTWFSFFGISNLIDKVHLTYHSWQNDDVFGFILEQCQEKNIEVSIEVPLEPNRIVESREKVKYFQSLGYMASEQILFEDDGLLYRRYSTIDENRIFNRPDDYVIEPMVIPAGQPDPNYVDLTKINAADPVYTGFPCYAGVDWIYIGPKGFASYSQCGGRNEQFNVFDTNWQPPSNHFPCSMNQCRSEQDQKLIRIVGS